MANIGGTIFLLVLIAAFVGLIVLQVKLSKKERTMPGLILPIVFLAFALIVSLLFGVFMVSESAGYKEVYIEGYYDEDGIYHEEIIEGFEETIEEEENEVGVAILPAIIITFLTNSVPAIVFLIIYLACHPTKKRLAKKAELDKMSISDL